MPITGTIQTKYREEWIYLNPNGFSGPSAWNAANFETIGSANIYAIPPIMMSESNDNIDLSYSIIACKSIDEQNRQLLVSDAPVVPRNALTDLIALEGVSPIIVNTFQEDRVIYFSIKDLDSIETTAAEVEAPSGYNSNSIASLTTSLPLEATEADGVATVSFDITTLQDA